MLADTLFVHPAGPHILLAPPEGERAEEVGERPTRQILGSLRARYDLTVVDCGAQTTDASAAAVELADSSLVVLTPDLPDETVTGILEQIVDHQQDLASVASAIGDTTLEQMAADIGVPFHPAAEQFFKDKGAI
jgi:MinD-like ATPase involved in chromosome partitioning or flagellar assembly